jgi:hypothetical protein
MNFPLSSPGITSNCFPPKKSFSPIAIISSKVADSNNINSITVFSSLPRFDFGNLGLYKSNFKLFICFAHVFELIV